MTEAWTLSSDVYLDQKACTHRTLISSYLIPCFLNSGQNAELQVELMKKKEYIEELFQKIVEKEFARLITNVNHEIEVKETFVSQYEYE